MAAISETFKVGDLAPHLTVSFDGFDATELAGASVTMSMVRPGDPAAKIAGALCAVVDDQILYVWQHGDTDTAGDFRCEWVITYPDGEQQTVPTYDEDAFWVRFIPRIA